MFGECLEGIALAIRIEGIPQKQARSLLRQYAPTCPLGVLLCRGILVAKQADQLGCRQAARGHLRHTTLNLGAEGRRNLRRVDTNAAIFRLSERPNTLLSVKKCIRLGLEC